MYHVSCHFLFSENRSGFVLPVRQTGNICSCQVSRTSHAHSNNGDDATAKQRYKVGRTIILFVPPAIGRWWPASITIQWQSLPPWRRHSIKWCICTAYRYWWVSRWWRLPFIGKKCRAIDAIPPHKNHHKSAPYVVRHHLHRRQQCYNLTWMIWKPNRCWKKRVVMAPEHTHCFWILYGSYVGYYSVIAVVVVTAFFISTTAIIPFCYCTITCGIPLLCGGPWRRRNVIWRIF